jgi:hypothetical protein
MAGWHGLEHQTVPPKPSFSQAVLTGDAQKQTIYVNRRSCYFKNAFSRFLKRNPRNSQHLRRQRIATRTTRKLPSPP